MLGTIEDEEQKELDRAEYLTPQLILSQKPVRMWEKVRLKFNMTKYMLQCKSCEESVMLVTRGLELEVIIEERPYYRWLQDCVIGLDTRVDYGFALQRLEALMEMQANLDINNPERIMQVIEATEGAMTDGYMQARRAIDFLIE